MKKITLLKSMLLLCALVVGSTSVWAQDQNVWSHEFGLDPESFKDTSHSSGEYTQDRTWNGVTWTATYSGEVASGKKYNIQGTNVGSKDSRLYRMQLGSSNSSMTFAMEATFSEKIKSVSVKAYRTGNTAGATLDIDVAGSSMGSTAIEKVTHTTAVATTYNLTTAKSGKVTISIANNVKQAVYVQDIVITFESTSATITDAEYATFVSPYATDFSTTGISVYTAMDEENQVTLNEITSGKVPANTPVVLHKAGADGTPINVPVVASADTPAGTNDLHVSTGTNVENMYVLSKKNGKVGFRAWTGTDLSAGKIYLQGKASYGAREFLGFGDATAINKVEAKKAENGVIYNLAGQQVAQPSKGLYIMNGRKVIVK